MRRVVVRIGGLVMIVLVLSAAVASAQDAPGGAPQLRWSFEGAAGVQLDYTGTIQSANVNEFFPHGVDRRIVVIYGAGARIPIHRRLDAFADWRLIITGDDAAEMAVLGPLRAGLAFRF